MSECNRCGKCCFYPTGNFDEKGREKIRACKYLIAAGNKFVCRIWRDKKRIGTLMGTSKDGTKWFCGNYKDIGKEVVGCPMNAGGKPLENREIISLKTGIKYDEE